MIPLLPQSWPMFSIHFRVSVWVCSSRPERGGKREEEAPGRVGLTPPCPSLTLNHQPTATATATATASGSPERLVSSCFWFAYKVCPFRLCAEAQAHSLHLHLYPDFRVHILQLIPARPCAGSDSLSLSLSSVSLSHLLSCKCKRFHQSHTEQEAA